MVHHVIKIYKEHCRTRENSNVLLGSEESRPSMCSIAKFLCLAVTHGSDWIRESSSSTHVGSTLTDSHLQKIGWPSSSVAIARPHPQVRNRWQPVTTISTSIVLLCLFVTLKPRRALSVCGCGKVSFVDNSIWIDQLLPQTRKVFGVLLQKSGSGFQAQFLSICCVYCRQLFSLCLVRYQRLIVYDPRFLRWCMKRYTVEKLNLPQRGRTASAKQT